MTYNDAPVMGLTWHDKRVLTTMHDDSLISKSRGGRRAVAANKSYKSQAALMNTIAIWEVWTRLVNCYNIMAAILCRRSGGSVCFFTCLM